MENSIQHVDKIGQPLALNDFVAFPAHNTLQVGIITKLNNKMVKIKKIEPPKRWESAQINRYPRDCLKVEGSIVSIYILKHTGAK